jgi:preprotein translocase subunit SecG
MYTFLLILQVVVVLIMVVTILLQQNDGGNLAGLAGGGNNIISSKAKNNFITKFTIALGLIFMANSLALARLTIDDSKKAKELLESINKEAAEKELTAPVVE